MWHTPPLPGAPHPQVTYKVSNMRGSWWRKEGGRYLEFKHRQTASPPLRHLHVFCWGQLLQVGQILPWFHSCHIRKPPFSQHLCHLFSASSLTALCCAPNYTYTLGLLEPEKYHAQKTATTELNERTNGQGNEQALRICAALRLCVTFVAGRGAQWCSVRQSHQDCVSGWGKVT